MHQQRGNGGLGSARAAIGDLQRNAQPAFGNDADENCLGPGLQRSTATRGAHQFGAGATLAGDKFGMGRHRLNQPALRIAARPAARRGECRHGAGQPLDRAGEIRRRAAIYAPTGRDLARHLLKGAAHGLLDRVIQLDIFRTAAQMPVQGQKPRMLARTIVVYLAGRDVGTDQPAMFLGVLGQMRAAAQVALGQPQPRKP